MTIKINIRDEFRHLLVNILYSVEYNTILINQSDFESFKNKNSIIVKDENTFWGTSKILLKNNEKIGEITK